MEYSRFNFRTKQQIEEFCTKNEIPLGFDDDLRILSKSVKIGNKIVQNSLGIHPMEGCDADPDGSCSDLAIRRYKRFAQGGAGLIWFEATAVNPKGKANPRQLRITEENLEKFKDVRELIKRESNDCIVIMQLTHSGRFSKPEGKMAPVLECRNDILDRHQRLQKLDVITDDELESLENDFAKSAKLAYQAGFDGVDMKACHRYLNSGLLGAFTREGRYGGSFENRIRFLLNCIDKIKAAVNDDNFIISTRINIYDSIPYPYGFGVDKSNYLKPDYEEPIKLAKILYSRGVRLLNVTMGTPYYNPHVNRPFDIGEYIPHEHPLEGVLRLIQGAATIKKAVPELIIMGTGYSWLRNFAPYAAAYVKKNGMADIIGFGREALAYPDFAYDIINNNSMAINKCCICCGKCVELMRAGSTPGCVVKDTEVYLPLYKEIIK